MTGAQATGDRPEVDGTPAGVVPMLRAAAAVAFVAAVAALLTTGALADTAGAVAVAAIVAAPLVRVVLLVGHWARRRDTRFVAVGLVLLAITAVGALAAM